MPPNEILEFRNADQIELNYSKMASYEGHFSGSYDQKKMASDFAWHQVIIHHKGKLNTSEAQKLILDAIFDVVGNEEFYPVAYRRGDKRDKFLVRKSTKALEKLFASNLRIRLQSGQYLSLTIQLYVAEFKYGQIAPHTNMALAIHRLLKNLNTFQQEKGLLNLSGFDSNSEFDQLVIRLSNPAVLSCVCDMIYKNDEYFGHIKSIIFSHNEINTIVPLQIFRNKIFTVLDLRYNNLSSISNICRDLKPLKGEKLLLAGNPVTESSNYPGDLNVLSKNFSFLDDVPMANLSKHYTPTTGGNDSQDSGYRVEKSNAREIHKFAGSSDWHGVMIPDSQRQYTKDEIIDYFFLTVSNELDAVYPCYYKFAAGEHRFLLRNCFPQLLHLVEGNKMEIKIPTLQMGSENDGLSGFQVTYERVLCYYLQMNISAFKHGEIEPAQCIEDALNRRFNVMDRLLDLKNFQSTPGLENIIVNLSSPTVLYAVISQAARKFAFSFVEIRLSHNKILNVNFSKALHKNTNVQAIDLGNNWIHELQDIQTLQCLKLKALRLDGNPLCAQYSLKSDYIESVKQIFPDIHKLDNVEIKTTGNTRCQRNYLCDVEAYDLVERFIPNFFNTFEFTDRKNLKGLYHPNAMFTLTCKYKPYQSTQQNISRRDKYQNLSRNVLCLMNMSFATTNVHVGPDNIIKTFTELPKMSFDLLSFTIDVPIFNDNMIVIIVTGTLADQNIREPLLESEIIMAFSRTFLLTPVETNIGVLKRTKSYQIKHDLFSVYNASELQARNAFKYYKNEETRESEEITSKDKEALLIMFHELTGLKSIWCTRCLGDANWNFKNAMDIFVELNDKKEIPATAFV